MSRQFRILFLVFTCFNNIFCVVHSSLVLVNIELALPNLEVLVKILQRFVEGNIGTQISGKYVIGIAIIMSRL